MTHTTTIQDPDEATELLVEGPFSDGSFLVQARKSGASVEVAVTAGDAERLVGALRAQVLSPGFMGSGSTVGGI